jgi:hypothetical protein
MEGLGRMQDGMCVLVSKPNNSPGFITSIEDIAWHRIECHD